MRRKKLLEITLCAVLTIGALLCCMQDASARETLLISGNADLYPIESYDRSRECYVGLLPELYERLSEQTGYDLVYLPYSKNTTQAQQAENRQADIISAYPSGTVDSGAMRRQVLLCTIEHDGAERAIYVGFTNALTPERAGALAQALEDLSGAESIGVLTDYMNSSGAEAYRTRWLITLAALIAAMLAAAVALIVFARKKRAEQKTNALIDLVVGVEDVKAAKPAPDGINAVCRHFGLAKKDVLYIGDNTIDGEAARNAGVAFAAVTTGTTKAAEFAALPHVAIMKDLSEILTLS